jgi:Clp amino terminal domain, pathogenicity island component
MPKINVYLPDDLATAVREAGIPVSPVCQHALTAAVRAVNSARATIAAIRDPGFDPAALPMLGDRMRSRMTPRLGEAIGLAEQAGDGRVGTAQLLLGVIGQGDNFGLRLLEALDLDAHELVTELGHASTVEPFPGQAAAADGTGATRPGPHAPLRDLLTLPAWRAFAAATEAAVDLGHNYLGCEHLVIGLMAEEDGVAGEVLRGHGARPDNARKTLTSMAAGYQQGKHATLREGAGALAEVIRRLDALETRVAALGDATG